MNDTPADDDAVWVAAYLHALDAELRFDDDGFPVVGLDALFGLVNLGAHVRAVTAGTGVPVDAAIRRLSYQTDDLLATVLVPAGDDVDAHAARVWRDSFAAVKRLLRGGAGGIVESDRENIRRRRPK